MLTVKEAAEKLGVSQRTIQRWIKVGRLRAVEQPGRGRGGMVFMIPEDEIKKLINDRTNDNNDINDRLINDNNDINDTPQNKGKDKTDDKSKNYTNDTNDIAADTAAISEVNSAPLPQCSVNSVEHKNDEIFEGNEWWISLEFAAAIFLPQISVRTLRWKIQKALELYGKDSTELALPDGMRVKKFPAKNRQGYRWMVGVASLPISARLRWAEKHFNLNPNPTNPINQTPDFSSHSENIKKILAQKIYKLTPRGQKDKAIRELAEKLGVSRTTIYRWIKNSSPPSQVKIGEEKYEIIIPRCSIPEKLFIQAVAWMAEDPKRRSIKEGHEYLQKLCQEFGCEPISYSQWTRLLKKMQPSWKLIREWAVRGETAFYLENLPPIRRTWLSVPPYTVLCGDQHFCDYEAVDPLTGEIVKVTIYMWIDCTSRYWAGVWPAFGTYTRYTVGLSFAEAVKIALPEYCYNDWGKQERSKYFKEFRQRLSGWFPGEFADFEEFKKRFPEEVIKQKRSTPGLPPVKPIEAAFRKFERMMLKRGIPGLARGVTLPDHWERKQIQETLKKARKRGELPTVRELLQEILAVVKEHNEGSMKAEGVKICPAKVLKEGLARNPRPVLPEETIEVLCYPWEKRKVNKSSVSISYRGKVYRYTHPRLLEFRGEEVWVAYEPPLFPEDVPERVYVLQSTEKGPEILCVAKLFAGSWVHPLEEKTLRKAKEEKMEILHQFKQALKEIRKKAGLETKEVKTGRVLSLRPKAERLRKQIAKEKELERKTITNEEALEILARSMGVEV